MASAKSEHITGVWRRSPQQESRGQSPRWEVRGEGEKLNAEVECIFVFACPKEGANLSHY